MNAPLALCALLSGALFLLPTARPQDTRTFPTGRLLERVQSASNPSQHFALYLPAGFEATRPTPILFLMDPRGRARVPARVFQSAADRFGYILISSYNTSSDSDTDPNFVAMQAMWADANRWFTLAPGRIYVAGFSGTARTASVLGNTRPVITGVIGAGAGFHTDVRVKRDLPFLYYGTVGTSDYNYHEVDLLSHELAALDVSYRIDRISGAHSWMPADAAMRAIEWFELRALREGTRSVDQALIAQWWRRDASTASARMTRGAWLEASRQYAAMARDYAGIRDVSYARAAAQRLTAMSQTRAELKRRRSASRDAINWVEARLRVVAEAFPVGERTPTMPAEELVRQLTIAQLKQQAESDLVDESLEAGRRLNQLGVQLGFYLPQQAISQSEWLRARYYLTASLAIDDASPVSWYLMASVDARLQGGEQAMVALRRAVDAGFRDVALLQNDPAFARLRNEPAMRALIDELQLQGDALDVLTVDRPPVMFRR
ncbi:MAG: hypothetical protein AB7L71_17255 [Vicinamibacterales bacterium]